MMNRKQNMASTKNQPTVDQLIAALRANMSERGIKDSADQYAYLTGYLGSMLEGLAAVSPKLRKDIQWRIDYANANKHRA